MTDRTNSTGTNISCSHPFPGMRSFTAVICGSSSVANPIHHSKLRFRMQQASPSGAPDAARRTPETRRDLLHVLTALLNKTGPWVGGPRRVSIANQHYFTIVESCAKV